MLLSVLRERYLRNDVGCGISGCRTCVQPAQVLLPFGGSTESKLFPDGHFVVPDTNVFLAQVNDFSPFRVAASRSTQIIHTQMDLMESTLFNPPVILLQTVLEEVRHRSLPLYNRLRALVKSDDKRIWVFYNEFHS